MALDISTLLLSALFSSVLMIVALVFCVGLMQAPTLRSWTLSLASQAVGFAFLIAAASLVPRLTASIGIFFLSLSVSFLQITTARFIQTPVRKRAVLAPAVVLGLVHWLIYPDTQSTVCIANLAIGTQSLWAAFTLLYGAHSVRWRWLVGGTALLNGLLLFSRAYLIVFHFDSYPAFVDPHPLNAIGMLILSASMVLGTVGFLLAHRDEAEQALQQLATFDSLTGLYNRRAWLDRSQAALHSPHSKAPPILMMLDIDFFKQINDTWGHPVGDKVLKLFGDVTKATLRHGDLACRYGGEEFCILLNDCLPEYCGRFDTRLREQLLDWSKSELGFEVQFSAGWIVCTPGVPLTEAIKRIDDALYRAKAQGRNQTVLAD